MWKSGREFQINDFKVSKASAPRINSCNHKESIIAPEILINIFYVNQEKLLFLY